RGRVLAEAGRSEQAIAATVRAIELMRAGQEAPAARIAASEALVARLHCEAGDSDAAQAWLASARKLQDAGGSAALREAEAGCALAQGMPEAALEWLAEEVADAADVADSGRARRDVLRVQALLQAGQRTQAADLLRKVGRQIDA